MSNLPLLTPCRTPSTKPVKELTYKDKNILLHKDTKLLYYTKREARSSLILASIQDQEENNKEID